MSDIPVNEVISEVALIFTLVILQNNVSIDKDDLQRFNDKLLANIQDCIDPVNGVLLSYGIFPTAACINHSCLPNTVRYTDNNGMLVFRSNRAIQSGEEITTNRIPEVMLTRSKPLRNIVTKQLDIHCTCIRCTVDNKEYRCPTCGLGVDRSMIKTWEPLPEINLMAECTSVPKVISPWLVTTRC
ncbi:hypothetical protein SAMD00019534_049030 [Acytostelium subglobosum LB1]|uniref:hypothetical protein n=1 Tax=Acytostelium subglobosum LB1 TaxID=1410327 RepID=UPI000644C25C|nr:hypothetical protein SAMD00019534_049030 [Acytostelium subglobosum LB1]GAM21728.1 hypothetical protein SAMD00019534_049030 [Acytostelium subglobosum LB1]|eukprot:XP_012754828.1 hypothetical protein SAMD00019534_049030 [Acytostelium subglobosum LB1]